MLQRALLIIGLLPVCAVTAAYSLAVANDLVPGCNPFVDGCTSISATGRYAPASYIFKPAHLLQSVLLALLWFHLPRVAPAKSRLLVVARICGLSGAAALVIYTLTLGSQTPLYEFMRRFGIYFFFLGTIVAQLLTTLWLRTPAAAGGQVLRPRVNALLVLALVPVALGVLNFAGKAVLEDPDLMENRIEWSAALIMQSWFMMFYLYQTASSPAQPNGDRSSPSDPSMPPETK